MRNILNGRNDMNEIIKLKDVQEFKTYDPILVLNEDIYSDNHFCVLNTNRGNIAFSYYDLGVAPSFLVQNEILFLNFGQSAYVIDLSKSQLLYRSNNISDIIFEIVKVDKKSCILFIGELSLLCFNLKGQLIWKNSYRNSIYDWKIDEDGISVIFESEDKILVLYENGNGVTQ